MDDELWRVDAALELLSCSRLGLRGLARQQRQVLAAESGTLTALTSWLSLEASIKAAGDPICWCAESLHNDQTIQNGDTALRSVPQQQQTSTRRKIAGAYALNDCTSCRLTSQ
eukprot:17970-Heterococcus_DN1.PRE.3